MESKKVKVSFEAYGSISQLLGFSGNGIILLPGESATVKVFLKTTNSTQVGNYSGEVDVVIQKPKYDFLYSIL